MTWIEILIIVLAAGFVAGVILFSALRRKHGKTSCGCDCGCSSCPGCSREQKKH